MGSRRERRASKLQERREQRYLDEEPRHAPIGAASHGWYDRHYAKLVIISIAVLLLAFGQLGLQHLRTGDFLSKGVSLQGGITVTVATSAPTDLDALRQSIAAKFPESDISVRAASEFGTQRAILIEASGNVEDPAELERLQGGILGEFPADAMSTVEIVGPSLGKAFFRQTLQAIAIAFVLMGMVVFFFFGHLAFAALPEQERGLKSFGVKAVVAVLSVVASVLIYGGSAIGIGVAAAISVALIALYVRYSIPSAAVVLAAFSDIIVTLAIVNVLGVRLSTAGIAAFLMLIGYSVDTDILLSVRALKRHEGTLDERIFSSMKTGILMVTTTFCVALVSLLVTHSETIKQIMLIVLIGTIVDIINTWIQNAGIIKWWAQKKGYA